MARVLIIGGGVIGSAIACFLHSHPGFDGEIMVVERDPSYARASSALSASSIRQQYSCAINIAMSRFGIEFLRNVGDRLQVGTDRPDVGLREAGYLYLAGSASAAQALRDNHVLQQQMGADIGLFETAELATRFPWLNTHDLVLGSLGLSGEGWFDGYSLLQAFRRKARALGVSYLHDEVVGLEMRGARIVKAQLAGAGGLGVDLAVNAAGPWAASIARMAGIDLPVHARRRCVFVFSCAQPIDRCPLVIDPSGLWFRPEGRGFICGMPPELEIDDQPLEVEHSQWQEQLWPRLAQRVPAFEALRQHAAWAGYYEYNSFDHNAILGPHPACDNLYFANGFSGHGMQQAPAVGRGLAELICSGRYQTLDLAELGFERILGNRPLLERNVI
jgi:FAD-dependent oxidoreductase domain-containing protein 1